MASLNYKIHGASDQCDWISPLKPLAIIKVRLIGVTLIAVLGRGMFFTAGRHKNYFGTRVHVIGEKICRALQKSGNKFAIKTIQKVERDIVRYIVLPQTQHPVTITLLTFFGWVRRLMCKSVSWIRLVLCTQKYNPWHSMETTAVSKSVCPHILNNLSAHVWLSPISHFSRDLQLKPKVSFLTCSLHAPQKTSGTFLFFPESLYQGTFSWHWLM